MSFTSINDAKVKLLNQNYLEMVQKYGKESIIICLNNYYKIPRTDTRKEIGRVFVSIVNNIIVEILSIDLPSKLDIRNEEIIDTLIKCSKLDKYKLMWGVSLTGVPFNTTINSNNVDVIYPSIYGSVTKNKS